MEWKSLTPWNWMQKEQVGVSKGAPLPITRAGWPTASLTGLHHEIDRLFSDAMRGFGLQSFPEWRHLESHLFRPKLDIAEEEKSYTIQVEMPGIKKENVEVTIAEDCLTIRGEKKEESSHKEGQRHYTERSFGSFQRQLALPADADEDSLTAHFEDGILRITLARKTDAVPPARRIEIH